MARLPFKKSSGQIIIIGNIEDETIQVMANIGDILTAAGMDFSNVVKSSIFMKDMNNFPKINEVYGNYFQRECPGP